MLSPDVLHLDAAGATAKLSATLREQVLGTLRRRGAVLGVSGGVDSAVVLGLCARALGPERVLALLLPERDSSPDALTDGQAAADHFGVRALVEPLGAALQAIGCYARQDDAIRSVFPAYGAGWKCKLSLPSILESARLNVFFLTVENPAGERFTSRLAANAYRQLVAATGYKQRLRKSVEYYHADRLQYAVAGTSNRLELDQGFFVKQGDGAADLKPIAHLYKTQVYQLADYLGVPQAIRAKAPTTDTFSLAQTQEEFFFALPWREMDLCLYALEHGLPAADVATAVKLEPEQVERVFRDLESKRRGARYLHSPPLYAGAPTAEG